MGNRMFKTAVDNKHEFGENRYILGRISGIMYAMCGGQINMSYGHRYNHELDIWVLTAYCTEKQYAAFSESIEEQYPGLCVFDYAG